MKWREFNAKVFSNKLKLHPAARLVNSIKSQKPCQHTRFTEDERYDAANTFGI